jgi:hypothetical protein
MEFLNHHVDQAYVPRIRSKALQHKIARAALKNIPGSENLIKKVFETNPVPKELPLEKPIDLVMHTGFIQH